MKRKVLVCLLSVLLLLSLAGCGSTEQAPELNDSQPSGEVEQQPDEASGPSVKYGELLELTDNRETNGVVIVKAKITPNATNKLTVAQNYHNAVDLIAEQGYSDCELQYWAVADMSDGSEGKVISFTVPADIVEKVASGDVVATQLPDLVTDLWILPSLSN